MSDEILEREILKNDELKLELRNLWNWNILLEE
jgi:hypothetical protein